MTSVTGQSSWPVISTCLPKISSSSAARASGSTRQVSRRSLGLSPASSQVMTRRTQGLAVIVSISAATFSRGRRVLPRARVAASSPSFWPALASVVPVNPRAWLSCSPGEWVRIAPARRRRRRGGCRSRSARRSAPYRPATCRRGQGGQVRAVAGGHRPDVAQPGAGQEREVVSLFCPASKTTAMSAGCCPHAAVTGSYRALSWG